MKRKAQRYKKNRQRGRRRAESWRPTQRLMEESRQRWLSENLGGADRATDSTHETNTQMNSSVEEFSNDST